VLRCDPPPAVLAPGPGTLSVRNNVGWSLEPQPVEYAFLIDVALDRRPYIAEAQGALLLRCNASLVGTAGVTVAATIPTLPAAATASWRWANVQLNSSTVLRFDLSSLPPTTVNADIEIVISGGGGLNITKHRRFMRAPSAAGEVQAAQIDHATRGLLVGGDPFGLGTGWYIDGNEERLWKGNISAYAAAMERQASLGDNWVLPYGLSSRFTPSEQRWFLDRCAEQRVKVMMPLAPSIGGARDKDYDPWIRDPAWLDWVRGNVSLVSNHSSILGYYVRLHTHTSPPARAHARAHARTHARPPARTHARAPFLASSVSPQLRAGVLRASPLAATRYSMHVRGDSLSCCLPLTAGLRTSGCAVRCATIAARLRQTLARKRHFLSHLYIKINILPRQARDKHRENSKKVSLFIKQGRSGTSASRPSCTTTSRRWTRTTW
jgi:hypothetical protein